MPVTRSLTACGPYDGPSGAVCVRRYPKVGSLTFDQQVTCIHACKCGILNSDLGLLFFCHYTRFDRVKVRHFLIDCNRYWKVVASLV